MTKRTPEELDQEYSELLSELRVILPGIQLLAAFLLILPFNTGFDRLSELERSVYFVSFLAAVVSSVLTIAPSSQHRIRWRHGDKEQLLRTANRLTIAGTGFLALALGGSVFLVGELLYGELVASVVVGVLVAAMAWWWFFQPLRRAMNDGERGRS